MSGAPSSPAPALILIHGAGGTGADWGAILPYLQPYEVLAPSLPGRDGVAGPAPKTAGEAARFLADEVLAPYQRRGSRPYLAVGISYGGAIAMELALAAPEGLAGLVLISTGARLRVHPSIFESLEAGLDPARQRAVHRADVPLESALADWRSVNAFDRLGQALDVRVPCLVMGGLDDTLTPPKYARYLASAIPGAELELIPGAGHMLPDEQPEATAARILRFLRERAANPM